MKKLPWMLFVAISLALAGKAVASGAAPPLGLALALALDANNPATVSNSAADSGGAGARVKEPAAAPGVEAPERFFHTDMLPPPGGAYVLAREEVVRFPSGLVLSNIWHWRFGGSVPRLPPGAPPQTYVFHGSVDLDVAPCLMCPSEPVRDVAAPFEVRMSNARTESDGRYVVQTEMLSLNLTGGNLPPGAVIRESPSRPSPGQTTIREVRGGFMISSVFDVFLEVSMDGIAWTPALNPAHVELVVDPTTFPAVSMPSRLLPPPTEAYVSPEQYHIVLPNGLMIRNIWHWIFTGSIPAPTPGSGATHSFNSVLDLDVALGSGAPWTHVRANSTVQVGIQHRLTMGLSEIYDTEMLSLNAAMPGLMIRESPTKRSQGGTVLTANGADNDCDSFFDIYIEVSTDGFNWTPADPPARVQLVSVAPAHAFDTADLPPTNGEYISPPEYAAQFPGNLIVKEVKHWRFPPPPPPPPPGGMAENAFDSQVDMMVSMDGGTSWTPVSAPAATVVSVFTQGDPTVFTYYEAEIKRLDIQGGNLPANIRIRESPSLPSLGRTSQRLLPDGGGWQVDSFFDIFLEVSIDGGLSWRPSLARPMLVVLQPGVVPPLGVNCPPNMRVRATGPQGAVVNYPPAVALGGCPPVTVNCQPLSGSVFPVGVNTVTCTAVDRCGQTAACSFQVVVRPWIPAFFFRERALPPTDGVYVTTPESQWAFANGLVIRDVRHRGFNQSIDPQPTPDPRVTPPIGSIAHFDLSTDGGHTWQSGWANADTTVSIEYTGLDAGEELYASDMTALTLSGGSLLENIKIRESPTTPGAGETTLRAVPGGFMVSSFFEIFIEVSTDGGATWARSHGPGRVELRPDPIHAPQVAVPARPLPSPNEVYVLPEGQVIRWPNGWVIKDIKHWFFGPPIEPPPVGPSVGHHFESQLDFQLSLDGGATWRLYRSPAATDATIGRLSMGEEEELYDGEMTGLDIRGGDLPPGVMIRESPTEPSRGMTRLQGGGGGAGGSMVGSFFDIFVEVSTDGGFSWLPASSGPAHIEARQVVEEEPFPGPELPPATGEYVTPPGAHARFANGLIITNVRHHSFSQAIPPPQPGEVAEEIFDSVLDMLISTDGGAAFMPLTVSAQTRVRIAGTAVWGLAHYFDAEMLALNLGGESLPIMIRESPTRPSLGRTSERSDLTGQTWIDSFFDVFLEVSTDGGQSWSASTTGPLIVVLQPRVVPPLSLRCPPDQRVPATGPQGAVVNYPPPVVSGGCPPYTVTCRPASGSLFPVGTSPVVCTATDRCGQSASCAFQVTVRPWAPACFFRERLLPPPNGVYVTPAIWHAAFNSGIIIRDVRHRRFTQGILPPPLGTRLSHAFGSQVEMELSRDSGATWLRATAPAEVEVSILHTANDGVTENYSAEMTKLNLSGGGLPDGVMIRESPADLGAGETTMRAVEGGVMISSFFDIFIEVSIDGGRTWERSLTPAHVELRPDPILSPEVPVPTALLPSPNEAYDLRPGDELRWANNLVIRDIRHWLFTPPIPPPQPGDSVGHHFDSQLDFQLSFDGGTNWRFIRAPGAMEVLLTRLGSGSDAMYDAEMTSLRVQGGDLPLMVMIRESPTEPSRGLTRLSGGGGGGAGGGAVVQSFFDIFIEVSTDGGVSWTRPTTGPAHMEARAVTEEQTFPTPELPPPSGAYVTLEGDSARFPNGLIVTDVRHRTFSKSIPPPPPGQSQLVEFGSWVDMLVSTDHGATYGRVLAPAATTVLIAGMVAEGATLYADAEMTQLAVQGGDLPAGIMIRESPTRPSSGRTSVRTGLTEQSYVDSFFDVFLEVSTDGGTTWHAALEPLLVVLRPFVPPPLGIRCPPNQFRLATSPAGAVVNYPPAVAVGGCPPVTIVCNPLSGSTFPVGVNTVTCTASDSCGQVARCTFTVTVRPFRRPPEIFFPQNTLPPLPGVYITPAQWHVLYANGVVIRDVKHRLFTNTFPPPAPGETHTHTFDSVVDFQLSTDGGATWQPASAPAKATVQITQPIGGSAVSTFETEMLALEIGGGPGGVGPMIIRESPTLPSLGRTTIRSVPGGYMIGSFFDIFTELSTDGGGAWLPGADGAPVELRYDPARVTPIAAPTALLPPPGDRYVSPPEWHAAYAQGFVIRDVKHLIFTRFLPPPPSGVTNVHTFDSIVDFQYSSDSGASWRVGRANAAVQVSIANAGSGASGLYDTEMLALNVTGGDLPATLRLRENPREPSRGGTEIHQAADGTFRISSFFDIFTELSTDGGTSWSPSTTAPAHVELITSAPEDRFVSPDLPPSDGRYISPQQWHALYQQGIVVRNVVHHRFTQSFPPPPPGPGLPQVHTFDSTVEMDVSTDNGQTFSPVSAPAKVRVQIRHLIDSGNTRYFDTEMLQLDIALPNGVMIRESPTRASLGRTSERPLGLIEGYYISSFFDIWTELSVDGGQTWAAALNGPAQVYLEREVPQPPEIIDEPDDTAAYCFSNAVFCVRAKGSLPLRYQWSANGVVIPGATNNCLVVSNVTMAQHGNVYQVVVTNPYGSDTSRPAVLTVLDVTPPVIVCPADRTVDTDRERCDARVQYALPAAGDACGRVTNLTCRPPSGSTLPLGPTVVLCSVYDQSGNSNGCTFRIIVVDRQPPGITCPAAITLATDPGTCARANVTYAPTITDNCPGVTSRCEPPSGSTFGLGTRNVVCSATDGSGNTSTCSFTVTIVDRELPRVICPPNLTFNTDPGQCSKSSVTFTATATDNCPDVSVAVRCEPASGSTFQRGQTTVTCTATDGSGNSSNCTFTVTVRDQELPRIDCPAAITLATDPGTCAKTNVTYTPTVTDNCPGATTRCEPPSGSTFGLGTRNVVCTATDGSGNTANCSFTVTIVDREPPRVICPPNLTFNTDPGQCSKNNVTFTATATDNCPGVSTPVQCTPASGSTFQRGQTTVTCIATDGSGNSSICTFTVTVRDQEPPRLVCPKNITGSTDSGLCSKSNVTFAASATDNCPDAGVPVRCEPASGSTFPRGSTTVTCTATDGSGNSTNCTFTVTIRDTEPPGVICPRDMVVQATGPGGAQVSYPLATATDNCDIMLTATCMPPSGSTFPLGTNVVTCTATDTSDNQGRCTFVIVVVLGTNCVSITCPPDIQVSTCGNSAVVTYQVNATNRCGTGLTVECQPPSGSSFGLGTTRVTCVAYDSLGNTDRCSFDVTVRGDSELPRITCPNDFSGVADAGRCSMSNVVFAPTVTDNCPGVRFACEPPSGTTFPVGTTTVTCTATDASQNQSRCSFQVRIIDREPPRIICPTDLTVVAYARTGVVVNYPAPSASDNCAVAAVVCQPPSSSVFGLGARPVLCLATDPSGNSSNCTFMVTVNLIGLEVDRFDYSLARLTLQLPGGQQEALTLAGPTEVEVIIGSVGQVIDLDGNGREQALAEMKRLDLAGHGSLGSLQLRLQTGRPTLGQIEERVNNVVGRLDVLPFAKSGLADSFFNVWFEIAVGTMRLHNVQPMRMAAVLSHKPPAVGETYTNVEPVELVDAQGNETGIRVIRVEHVPEPPKEVDVFPNSEAFLTVQSTTGAQPLNVFLRGPSTVEVTIPPSGWAADTDNDARDQAPARMTQLDLRGELPMIGPVVLMLATSPPTLGGVEERLNLTSGILNLPPFVMVSPTPLLADSFFDVSFEVTIGRLAPLHPAEPVHMLGVLSHKPPAPGEAFTNAPSQGRIRLLFADGTPSEYELVRVVHTPIPAPTACPKLSVAIDRAGDPPKIRVCWPGTRTDCVLQAAPSLNPPIGWQNVVTPAPELQTDGGWCVSLPLDGRMRYFRLCSGCPSGTAN